MNWEKLSAPKVHGDMGFKDLSAFNLAMLGNRDGNLLQSRTLLLLKFLKLVISRLVPISRLLLNIIRAMFGAVLCVLDL